MSLVEIDDVEPDASTNDGRDAAIIWLGEGDRALRYVYDDDLGVVLEQTWSCDVTYASFPLDDPKSECEAALTAVWELLTRYQGEPERLEYEWSHVYDLLVA